MSHENKPTEKINSDSSRKITPEHLDVLEKIVEALEIEVKKLDQRCKVLEANKKRRPSKDAVDSHT